MVASGPEYPQPAVGSTRIVVPSILNRAEHLRREAKVLLKRHYASRAPQELLEFVLASVDLITADLTQLVQGEEVQPTLTPEEFDRIVRRQGQLLIPLHRIMSFLDRSQVEETAAELVAPLRRLVSDPGLIPELDFVLQPVWSLNYYILDVRLWIEKAMSTGYPELVNRLRRHLVLLQFPKSEMGNVLLHCMVAHELGHHVYQHRGLADQLLGRIRLDEPPLAQLIDELVDKNMKQFAQGFLSGERKPSEQLSFEDWLPREQFRAAINRDLATAIQAWVEELACDAIAVELIGISYFFAFAELATSLLGLDDCAPSHPPARLRLTLMRFMLDADLKAAEESRPSSTTSFEYFSGIKEQVSRWDATLDTPRPTDPIPDSVQIAQTVVETILPDIAEVTRTIVGRSRNRCYDEKIDAICKQLRLLITCNEILSEPSGSELADIDQIMRGAWAFTLAGFPDWQKKYNYDDNACTSRLSELIMKSIELVEVTTILKEA